MDEARSARVSWSPYGQHLMADDYMRSVCLVGTSHNYQRDSSLVQESQIGEFRKMLCETIQREGLRGIAEEISKDSLHLSRNRRSVGKQLGDELGLVHMPMRPR
jgi:hypothetical protein